VLEHFGSLADRIHLKSLILNPTLPPFATLPPLAFSLQPSAFSHFPTLRQPPHETFFERQESDGKFGCRAEVVCA
jgi:hypothetical protein